MQSIGEDVEAGKARCRGYAGDRPCASAWLEGPRANADERVAKVGREGERERGSKRAVTKGVGGERKRAVMKGVGGEREKERCRGRGNREGASREGTRKGK